MAAYDDQEAKHSETVDPAILIPVSASDFQMRKRNRLRWGLLAVVVVISGIVFAYQHYTAPGRAVEAYDSAERLLRTNRYAQAILAFDRAIALQSDYAEAYLLRGRARMGISDTESGIQDFAEVIRLQPQNPQPYLDRAAAYLEMKDFKAARTDASMASGLNPKSGLAHNLIGSALRMQGDQRGALVEFSRAVELEGTLDNYFQRGATYQALGDYKQAIADYDLAIAFNPYSAQTYFARAEAKRALGDIEGANLDHRTGRMMDGR